MSYETVLLIGGPKDGERISVLKGVSSVRVHVPKFTHAHISGSGDPEDQVLYECAEYRRHPVQSSQGLKSCVYVFGDIDAMAALIDGYRKP